MEVRELSALLSVVRCGSFTEAARQLGFTQSAVSQQVAALEAELGQPLVLRRPVRATPAGRRLAEHAAHVLLRLEVAQSELAGYSRGGTEVTVACSPLAAPRLLAASLRAVRSSRPDLKVTVRSLSASAAVAAVASGDADAAMVDGIVGPSEPLYLADAGLMTSTWVAGAELVVALQAGHPLSRRPQLTLDSLVDAPWVVAPDLLAPGGGRARLSPPWREPLVYEGADLRTVVELVAAGLGAALLPAWACAEGSGVTGVPLSRPALVHRTELLALRTPGAGDNPVVRAVLATSSAMAAGPP
jgi:DNA-binding transcriptional LysR family regulator